MIGRPHFLAIFLLISVLALAWYMISPSTELAQNEQRSGPGAEASGILDGMTFVSDLGLEGEQADVKDELVFADGTFVSVECDKRCGYPGSPYFVRQLGDKVEFVSEAQCTRKDAIIVWRGIVDDRVIKGVFVWTVERWYWTIEKQFWFEGTLIDTSAPLPNHQ